MAKDTFLRIVKLTTDNGEETYRATVDQNKTAKEAWNVFWEHNLVQIKTSTVLYTNSYSKELNKLKTAYGIPEKTTPDQAAQRFKEEGKKNENAFKVYESWLKLAPKRIDGSQYTEDENVVEAAFNYALEFADQNGFLESLDFDLKTTFKQKTIAQLKTATEGPHTSFVIWTGKPGEYVIKRVKSNAADFEVKSNFVGDSLGLKKLQNSDTWKAPGTWMIPEKSDALQDLADYLELGIDVKKDVNFSDPESISNFKTKLLAKKQEVVDWAKEKVFVWTNNPKYSKTVGTDKITDAKKEAIEAANKLGYSLSLDQNNALVGWKTVFAKMTVKNSELKVPITFYGELAYPSKHKSIKDATIEELKQGLVRLWVSKGKDLTGGTSKDDDDKETVTEGNKVKLQNSIGGSEAYMFLRYIANTKPSEITIEVLPNDVKSNVDVQRIAIKDNNSIAKLTSRYNTKNGANYTVPEFLTKLIAYITKHPYKARTTTGQSKSAVVELDSSWLYKESDSRTTYLKKYEIRVPQENFWIQDFIFTILNKAKNGEELTDKQIQTLSNYFTLDGNKLIKTSEEIKVAGRTGLRWEHILPHDQISKWLTELVDEGYNKDEISKWLSEVYNIAWIDIRFAYKIDNINGMKATAAPDLHRINPDNVNKVNSVLDRYIINEVNVERLDKLIKRGETIKLPGLTVGRARDIIYSANPDDLEGEIEETKTVTELLDTLITKQLNKSK